MGNLIVATGTTTLTFKAQPISQDNISFTVSNVSGSSKFVSDVGVPVSKSSIRFTWSGNDIQYKIGVTSNINILTPTPLLYIDVAQKVFANYFVSFGVINKEFITIDINSIDPSKDVSWLNVIKSLGSGVGLTSDMILSTETVPIQSKSTEFSFTSMVSTLSINNNGVYIGQDGKTSYFANDTIQVPVMSTTYDGLSNDNGQYLVTIDIDEVGKISYSKYLMPFIEDIVWLNYNTILVEMDIGSHNGTVLSNVNYNNAKVVNTNLTTQILENGIQCNNVNYDMSYTLFMTVTE